MKISVVIVTYNRLEKLKKCLNLFSQQTREPDYMVIVDNASNDGTKEFLNKWKVENSPITKKYVLSNSINKGGSGGFYDGLEFASDLDTDWIWVSDDDAFPDVNAIKNSIEYLSEHNDEQIAAICGMVLNNGKPDFNHRRTIKSKFLDIKEIPSSREDYNLDEFEINAFSYVGAIINNKILKMAGLTNKDYFIWRDDTEHSLRLSKYGKIICVPKIIITHDVQQSTLNEVSWKDYYGYRNKADMYIKHFSKISSEFYLIKKRIEILYIRFGKRDKTLSGIYQCALNDAINHKLGVHPIYKPGWKPNGK